jgi:hypothetical protein
VLDAAGFTDDLEQRIVTPLRQAQAMFDTQPYLTRMLSTVSPVEMTRDPLFVLNPELPDVSNVHVATAYGLCQNDGTIANLLLQLEDGRVLGIDGDSRPYSNTPWPYAAGPAARRVELVGSTGQPIPVQLADVVTIDRALDSMPTSVVRTMVPAAPAATAGGCGCGLGRQPPHGSSTGWVGLSVALIGIAARRRRSRS